MGGNGDKGKISNVVVGGGGLIVNIEEHDKPGSVTLFDPIEVEIDIAVDDGPGDKPAETTTDGTKIKGKGIDIEIDQPEKQNYVTYKFDPAKIDVDNAVVGMPGVARADIVRSGIGSNMRQDKVPDYAYGPMHVPHVSGRSIELRDDGYKIVCPGCSFEAGRHSLSNSKDTILQNIRKGLHIKGSTVLDQPDIKPLPTAVEAPFQIVTGKSISYRDPPGYGFDLICSACAYLLGNPDNQFPTMYNMMIQGKHLHYKTEEVNPKTTNTTNEEVNPKQDPLTDCARGPMHIEHISGRNIFVGDTGYICNCPGCAYDLNICYPGKEYVPARKIIEQGLHLQNGKVLERSNIKPLSTPVSFDWAKVPGPSIKPRGPPSYGFDVACTRCVVTLGYMRDPIWCYNLLVQGKHLH